MDIQNEVENALVLLKSNQGAKVGHFRLEMKDENTLAIVGWSEYRIFENINKRIGRTELDEIKSIFFKMVDVSKNLRDFIQDKQLEFNLYFDDIKTSIKVCTEKNGVIQWFISR